LASSVFDLSGRLSAAAGSAGPTWTGRNRSLDGQPHHFLGSWTVFDPRTRQFSRLELPVRHAEVRGDLVSEYCAVCDDQLYILAVNRKPPRNVIVLQSKPA
jgi:hypothetical protein